ncbi:MAG: indolepyruvate ferredoxin oxidoreductase family protein, partial [Panacagrimonas sp.]
EDQIARHLYAIAADRRPALAGKQDLQGAPLLPLAGELGAPAVRRAIGRMLDQVGLSDTSLAPRLDAWQQLEGRALDTGGSTRPAYFCSGCPHNTSTRIPSGSIALGGIGCHGLAAVVMDRDTMQFMPMGHEGSPWTSVSHFVDRPHVFQNMGDGTYSHSGVLAIRAAVAAKANITYKLLYNDAVAMTGGQPVEQQITPVDMVRQLLSEGVRPVHLVSDDPAKFDGITLPPNTGLHHRDELDALQRVLRETKGVSAIVYEQTCAAEKRRRRKRGLMPDSDQRIYINPAVCEGCGDCSVQSNCISVLPLETEFGRKRRIDQSSCNKDYSCANGFCPSFVTVTGATIAVRSSGDAKRLQSLIDALPEPSTRMLDTDGYDVLVTGIGGTGVLTIGALLGMAAHLEHKGCTVLDMTGMAQKGGAVTSHIRFAIEPRQMGSARLSDGMTDLLIACDLVVGSGAPVLRTLRAGHTTAILNADVAPTCDFQRNKHLDLDTGRLRTAIVAAVGEGNALYELPASRLATELTGDSIATNVLMLGYAAQKGLLPVSIASLQHAIRLNGTFVEGNLRTFALGRLAAHAPQELERERGDAPSPVRLETVDDVLDSRTRLLTAYQDAAYAARYREDVAQVRAKVAALHLMKDGEIFVREVALTLGRLMAYKDEYEVARLYSDPAFLKGLREQFAGDFTLAFNLASSMLLTGRDSAGRPRKRRLGAWMLIAFRVLARFKFLRGTVFDPIGYTSERRLERKLIADYRALVQEVISRLNATNLSAAIELVRSAREIAGYGPVKHAAAEAYAARLPALRAAFEAAGSTPRACAA